MQASVVVARRLSSYGLQALEHRVFFIFFSTTVYPRILNIVSYATQKDLVVYPFYSIYVIVCIY